MGNVNIKQVPLKGNFLWFTLDTDPDQAKEVFKQRFGHSPELAISDHQALKLGPVNDQDIKYAKNQETDIH